MSDILDRIPEGYTPGPWWVDEVTGAVYAGQNDGPVHVGTLDFELPTMDLPLAVLAPELADAVRSLTAERDALRSACEKMVKHWDAYAWSPGFQREKVEDFIHLMRVALDFTPTDTEADNA